MLETIVSYLAYASLGFALVSAYLQTNKIWQRKHIPEVADSISIPGIAVESIPLVFFGAYFLVKGEIVGLIDSVIWLTTTCILVLIGSGTWVRGRRGKGFWRRVRSSVASEKQEMGALAKALFRPSGRRQLLDLLQALAEVDGEVSEREVELIRHFSDEWGMSFAPRESRPESALSSRLIKVSRALRAYLQTSPPSQQVIHIEELLHLLVDADGRSDDSEVTAMEEVKGLIAQYLSEDETVAPFHVLVAPQSQDQIQSLSMLIDESALHTGAGGQGFTVGLFHSRRYAEAICNEYRRLGYFTVITDDTLEQPTERGSGPVPDG